MCLLRIVSVSMRMVSRVPAGLFGKETAGGFFAGERNDRRLKHSCRQ